MRPVVRLAIVLLVALVLPLKGVAAVTMLACGHAHAAAAGEAHDHHDPAGHDAHAGHVVHDPVPSHDAHAVKCSSCAPCCAPAAPPGTPLLPGVQAPAVAATATLEVFHPGVIADVPHRPPRPIG